MAMKSLSRLEANKEVRRIFVRHGIDTSKVQFSCQGKSLTLAGGLFKEGGQEVENSCVETIIQELSRIGVHVSNCELANWDITDGSISRKGPKVAEHAHQQKTAAAPAKEASAAPKKS